MRAPALPFTFPFALALTFTFTGCATVAPPRDARVVQSRADQAFADGQYGMSWAPLDEARRAALEAGVRARLGDERDPEVRDRLVEALGKLSRGDSVATLSALLAGPERARAAVALGLIAKKTDGKAAASGATASLGALLADPSAAVRWAAAYALMRLRTAAARPLLVRGLDDRSPLVRATCAKGLGELPSGDGLALLSDRLDDADVRVAAEAARALAKLTVACDPHAYCEALERLAHSSHWRGPVMAAIAFEPITDPRAAALFAEDHDLYAGAIVPDLRTRGLSQCQAALAYDRVVGRLALIPTCGLGAVDERHRGVLAATALAQTHASDPARAETLIALSRRSEPAVRAAAADGLGALDDAASAAQLQAMLDDGDPAVVAAVAGAIEKRKLAAAGPLLVAQLARWHGPDAVETLQALLSAIGAFHLTGAAPAVRALTHDAPAAVCLAAQATLLALGEPASIAPARPDATSYAAEPLPREPRVVLRTARGVIRVQLFPAEAPATVRSFLSLVRKRFYDGLTFHRVVPGFVSQGGDPRGDGSGGPGYDLPCELNPRRYVEGTLGMALSGPDTGGSQFFFTHTPQPHLDGRYTVFGQIFEGVDVAAALLEGDAIESIRLE